MITKSPCTSSNSVYIFFFLSFLTYFAFCLTRVSFISQHFLYQPSFFWFYFLSVSQIVGIDIMEKEFSFIKTYTQKKYKMTKNSYFFKIILGGHLDFELLELPTAKQTLESDSSYLNTHIRTPFVKYSDNQSKSYISN